MELPKFGMPQNPDPYAIPQPESDKKKLFMMVGGIVALLLILGLVLFSGGGGEGQSSMKTSIQNSSDAIGILDEYLEQTDATGVRNDLSLALILLRGNQQSMNDLYKKTYPKAKSFSRSPKPDEESVEILDRAERNNVIDTEIIVVLKDKVQTSLRSLTRAKAYFTTKESRETISQTQEDLEQVYEILNRDR